MVSVAQLVELRIVAPAVVGSNPIAHPNWPSPLCGPLAQLVEQLTLNQSVAGSSPARPTIKTMCYKINWESVGRSNQALLVVMERAG